MQISVSEAGRGEEQVPLESGSSYPIAYIYNNNKKIYCVKYIYYYYYVNMYLFIHTQRYSYLCIYTGQMTQGHGLLLCIDFNNAQIDQNNYRCLDGI